MNPINGWGFSASKDLVARDATRTSTKQYVEVHYEFN